MRRSVSVSVVILVLNRAPLLTRALASAARQRELMPLETIVVDVELATGISLLKQAVVEGGCRIIISAGSSSMIAPRPASAAPDAKA